MPKKRNLEKLRKKYSLEDLTAALQDIKSGQSITSISKKYGIPRATLSYKINGKSPLNKPGGPPTVLSEEEESQIVRWIFHVSSYGHPVTKFQLINSVAKLIKNMKRETPFVNGRPGRSWYQAFLHRHPEIAKRVSQNLTHSRSSLTEHAVRGWFKENATYLQKKNLDKIGPTRIFNGDESAFMLNPKSDYVLVKKGDKSVYQHIGNNEKESLTVLFVANAAGELAPPMIVFSYERLPASITENIPKKWSIGKSQNGWMTSETFYEYITNVFEPWLTENKIERPVVLYIDGHSSHLTMELSDFCTQKQIELIALYPNATHIMQPLDVAFFKPLKAKYRECVTEWRLQHDGNSIKKENCASILKDAVDKIDFKKIIINGFKKCGLSPFNADAIDYSKLQKPDSTSSDMTLADKNSSEVIEIDHSDTNNFLDSFEKGMDRDLLAAFYESEATRTWQGDIQHLSLFNFWLNARKRYCSKSSTITSDNEESMANINSSCEETVNIESNHGTLCQNVNEVPAVIIDFDDDLNFENLVLDENILSLSEPTVNEMLPQEVIVNSPQEIIEFQETPKKKDKVNDKPEDKTNDDRIIPEGVPSPFKTALFWPKKESGNKVRKPKHKIPSAATSEEWKMYFIQKQKEKERKQEEMAEKRKKRREAAEEKIKAREEAKRIRLEKKTAREAEKQKSKKKKEN